MSITLITPLMLATSPVKLDVPAIEYDHTAQAQTGFQLAQWNTGTCFTTTTFNGTATYDFNGKPYDNDADSDSRGDC